VPTVGRPAAKFARAAKDLQTLLGDHHDCVVLRDLLVQSGCPKPTRWRERVHLRPPVRTRAGPRRTPRGPVARGLETGLPPSHDAAGWPDPTVSRIGRSGAVVAAGDARVGGHCNAPDVRVPSGWAVARVGAVILVRHAHAGNKALWRQADELRPLTAWGLAAGRLARRNPRLRRHLVGVVESGGPLPANGRDPGSTPGSERSGSPAAREGRPRGRVAGLGAGRSVGSMGPVHARGGPSRVARRRSCVGSGHCTRK